MGAISQLQQELKIFFDNAEDITIQNLPTTIKKVIGVKKNRLLE